LDDEFNNNIYSLRVITFLFYARYLNYVGKVDLKRVKTKVLREKILLSNIKYYTKHDNNLTNNSRIILLRCQIARLPKKQRILVKFMLLPIVIVFRNIRIIALYLHSNIYYMLLSLQQFDALKFKLLIDCESSLLEFFILKS